MSEYEIMHKTINEFVKDEETYWQIWVLFLSTPYAIRRASLEMQPQQQARLEDPYRRTSSSNRFHNLDLQMNLSTIPTDLTQSGVSPQSIWPRPAPQAQARETRDSEMQDLETNVGFNANASVNPRAIQNPRHPFLRSSMIGGSRPILPSPQSQALLVRSLIILLNSANY